MRARLIVNPASGMDRAPALLPHINRRLSTLARDLDITITTEADDATRAAVRAVQEGVDGLYVAGGDGTVNAVMRGLLSAPGDARPPVGVIPCGTGNDFAKALGLGEDPEAAIETLLDMRVLDVDIGLMNGRPFVNTSAGGFVADVSEAVTETLKDRAGKLAYLIGGARVLLASEPFSVRVRSAAGGDAAHWPDDEELQMFAVCNAPMIGGGYLIAPDALIDDGELDVLLVPRMPMLEFVAALQQIASGSGASDARVRRFRASAFELRFSRVVRVNVDGELLEADRCVYEVQRRAARFFCGPSPHASRA
jgi:diacylglycerol kinase (ATP)